LQHFFSRFSGIFIQNITQLSKELNLPLDNSPIPPTTTTNPAVENIAGLPKPVQNNLPGILGDAKLTAWEPWQKQVFSFLKIAVSYHCFHFSFCTDGILKFTT
jgi:ATP-dependent DNA helicase RecQ